MGVSQYAHTLAPTGVLLYSVLPYGYQPGSSCTPKWAPLSGRWKG